MVWFIIYMTFFGWVIKPIPSSDNLSNQCWFPSDRLASSFCVVSSDNKSVARNLNSTY